MTDQKLFAERRECISCGSSSTGHKRAAGEPIILSISLTMYRNGGGSRALKSTRRICICEECFVRTLAQPTLFEGSSARKLLAAIRERLSARYNAILSEGASN